MIMMKEEDNTRIGIIGTGDISRAFIKNANILNCNVTSVLSRNIQKAKDFANDYHIQNAYDNFEEFIKEINIVYVATPNHTHYQYAREALLKCKHV